MLDATDRCDRCGAQAYVAIGSTAVNEPLLFCAHHYREHEPALKEQGFGQDEHHIIDERDLLTKSEGERAVGARV